MLTLWNTMIHKADDRGNLLWSRGEVKVQLLVPGMSRPIGYCDGTEQDEEELRSIAESEGVDDLPIKKRVLKTGREIWTMGTLPAVTDDGETWG